MKNVIPYLLFSVLCNIPREGSSGKRGQLEITPVARAIARHMSVDLSPEGFAARNRTGIAIIVYGGPLTGEDTSQMEYCHLRVVTLGHENSAIGLRICQLLH